MVEFLCPRGSVYILENSEAQRVKVGVTGFGVNDVVDRLRDINDLWIERKVSCQICGGRSLNIGGLVPHHVVSGRDCPGGNGLPLQKDVAIAEAYLESVKSSLNKLSGNQKASAVRIANTLEKRIAKYRQYNPPVGDWKFRISFYTELAGDVETLSHKVLAKHLDRLAPFGEVFCCSVSEATEAVEKALSQLGVLNSAKKETQL